eukprot:TRINITY_DN5117_c0_g1_i2.p1 TRINITY_DN5117_c0_g1~~TRINITY_DN5117_c0_g1_i2.p1  ORF type:complete len:471 (-),score=140.63 TRINITY_DN5117_c0_g1_i2:326-1738(-)
MFSLAVHCRSLLPFSPNFSGNLTENQINIQNFTLPVVGSLSLTLRQVSPLLICIRHLVQPEFNSKRWSPSTCSSFLDLRNISRASLVAASASRIVLSSRSVLTKQGYHFDLSLDLLEGFYYIGFTSEKATSFNVDLTGPPCEQGFYGYQCKVPVESTPLPFNSSFPVSLNINETKVYQFTPSTTNSSYVLQNVEFTGEFDPTSVVVSRVKYSNTPNNTDNEGQYTFSEAVNQTKFLVPSPTNGNWFVSLKALKRAASFHLTWNSTQCDLGKAGSGCQSVNVLNGTNTTTAWVLTTPASDWQYFRWDRNENNTNIAFSFTVQTFDSNSKSAAPDLYLRYGQVPTENSYTIRVTNQTINRVDAAAAVYGAWFVGIKGTGQKYGFWYNGNCPSDCNSHGSCQPTPSGAFQCVCDDLYTNFDCSKRLNLDGFRKVYLVVIIIGAVLFGIAGLGFFCLFAMRKRRVEGYEILSQT